MFIGKNCISGFDAWKCIIGTARNNQAIARQNPQRRCFP
jgi:hypothetical protein